MMNRVHALTVVLDDQYREDDALKIVDAIRMIRGVESVETHACDLQTVFAVNLARRELREKIVGLLEPGINHVG